MSAVTIRIYYLRHYPNKYVSYTVYFNLRKKSKCTYKIADLDIFTGSELCQLILLLISNDANKF